MPRAVTFDFGQTLTELDAAFLATRLAERDVLVPPAAVDAAVPAAWRRYGQAICDGAGGHPWKTFMVALLEHAGIGAEREALADWLFAEQPRRNLWRRPVPGMIELVRALRAGGTPVGVVSNSEGRLAELARELGWGTDFDVIADSGVLGIEKPDPRIFAWAAARLGVATSELVHVGDSYPADVLGARAAGATPVWFRGDGAPAEVRVCRDAPSLRLALGELGL